MSKQPWRAVGNFKSYIFILFLFVAFYTTTTNFTKTKNDALLCVCARHPALLDLVCDSLLQNVPDHRHDDTGAEMNTHTHTHTPDLNLGFQIQEQIEVSSNRTIWKSNHHHHHHRGSFGLFGFGGTWRIIRTMWFFGFMLLDPVNRDASPPWMH